MSQNVKKVQAFLEFVNYNKKFIKNFFRKALSLINFIEKNKAWKLTHEKQRAFQKFKQACLQSSMLKIIDITKSIRIKTNAFDLIISACLN